MGVNKVVFNTADGEHTLIDISDSTVTAATLAKGQTAYGADGEKITGTMTSSASPKLQKKTVTPDIMSQVVAPDDGYDGLYGVIVEAMPIAAQATPTIAVDSNGKITASATQSAGYVSGGTKSATKQLITQGAQTITPGTADKTIASGRYLTGVQTIKGDANLVPENIVSGKTIFGVSGTAEIGGGDEPSVPGGGYEDDILQKTLSGIYKNDRITYLGSHALMGNPDLIGADFGSLTDMEGSCFIECYSLKAVVLRNESDVVWQGNDNFGDTPISEGMGFVYVPAALIADYESHEQWRWSNVSFRAIEDYTLDGTLTGEMDWEFIENEELVGSGITVYYLVGDPIEVIEGFPIEADEGMSWEDWVNSDFNADGMFAISDDGYVTLFDYYYVVFYLDGMLAEHISRVDSYMPVKNDLNSVYVRAMEYFE